METQNLNFSEIFFQLRDGKKCSRHVWDNSGLFIQAQFPDENSKMQEPYLFMSDPSGKIFPWMPGVKSLFANDWFVLE